MPVFCLFCWLFRSGFCLFQYKSTIIREKKGCQRQGNDEPDDAQETTPNGERKQDDGRIQSCNVSHDLGREDGVLNGLYDGKYRKGTEQDNPEVLACVCCFDEG